MIALFLLDLVGDHHVEDPSLKKKKKKVEHS